MSPVITKGAISQTLYQKTSSPSNQNLGAQYHILYTHQSEPYTDFNSTSATSLAETLKLLPNMLTREMRVELARHTAELECIENQRVAFAPDFDHRAEVARKAEITRHELATKELRFPKEGSTQTKSKGRRFLRKLLCM